MKEILERDEIVDSEHTWEEYFEGLKDGSEKYIPDLIKNTEDLSKLTSQDLVNANQAARNAVLAHNAALEKQTASAKAGQIAMKGLAMAGNIFVDMLVAKGIELAVTAIDKYVNRVKYAKEAMEEAQQAIDDAQNSLKNVSNVVSTNKDRFLELSEGVDKFSNNEFLSDDDYAEFLSISQEIAEIAPDLVSGYDEQGNALLRIGDSAEETGEILDGLVETEKKLADQTLADNLDEIANGVKYSVQETQGEIDKLQTELEAAKKNTDITGINLTEQKKNADGTIGLKNKGMIELDDEQYTKYGKQMEKALEDAGLDYSIDSMINKKTIMLTDDEISIDKLKKAQEYFDLSIEMQDKAYQAEEAGLKRDIAEKEKLIDEYYQKMSTNLQAWVKNDYQYQALNETNKKFVDSIIPTLDWNEIKDKLGLDSLSAEDYKTYIQDSIVNPLATVTDEQKKEVDKYISGLLSFDDGDLGIISYGKEAQKYFDKENIEIDISPIFSDEEEAYDKLQNSIKAIAGESEEDLRILQNYTSNFTRDEANRFEQVNLGAKSAREAIISYISTLQTDYSSSVEDLDTSVSSMTETQELFNSALDEQAQNGTLSEGTLASLRDKYDDLDKVLEITTNGIIINKDKLAELNAEEKKAIESDMASTREKLVDQYNSNSLAIANYRMQLEDTNSITDEQKASIEALLSVKEADQQKTKEQIAQLDLLGVEYDTLNSKTNAFLQSLSSADSGAIYDSVYSALEQVKEVYDAGDYGKDEFRNFVDYMTFEDMSTAPIEEVKAAYQEAMKSAETYFTEGNKGLNAFINKMEQFGMATKDANGNWDLSIDSVDTLAKKLGISSDAVQDILSKLKDKGWEINIETSDDGLVDTDGELEKLEKRLDRLNKKRLKLEADGESTKEIDKKIQETEKGISDIKAEIKVYADTEEAMSQILELQSQIEEIRENSKLSYSYAFEHEGEISQLEQEQQKLADKYNIDLPAVLSVNTDKADEKIEETKDKSEEETTFEVDANTDKAVEKIGEIFKKTYKLKVDISAKNKITNVVTNSKSSDSSGDGVANGTAIFGRAYANGKRGKISKGYKSKALVGELGAEMRVRDGKYEILGENGAEFTDVRPDDIIFNAEQTKEILKNGKTNARGNAYEYGTTTSISGGGSLLDEHTTSKKKKTSTKKTSKSEKDTEKKTKETNKSLDKFKETIDWCAETINKLTSQIDNINAKIALTASSLKSQLKYYKQLISKQKALVSGYSKTTSVYKKEYNKSLKGLSKADKKKVKNGTYTIEQFSGSAKSGSTSKEEKRYNKIQKAIEARDTYLSSQTELVNAKAQLNEYIKSLINVRWDKATEAVEILNKKIEVLDAKAANLNGYSAKNANIDQKLAKQAEQVKEQRDAYNETKADKAKIDKTAKNTKRQIKKKYTTKSNQNNNGTLKTDSVTEQEDLINKYNKKVKEAGTKKDRKAAKDKVDSKYKTKSRTNKDGTLKTSGVKDKEQLAYIKQYNQKVTANNEAQKLKEGINKKYTTKGRTNKDGTLKTGGVTDKKQLALIKKYNAEIKKSKAYKKELEDMNDELTISEEELKAAQTDAIIQKADNIIADYENRILEYDARETQLNSEIALAEAMGQVASADYYKQLAENSVKRATQLQQEKALILEQQKELPEYSDAWYEVQKKVNDVDKAINDETINAVENINKQIEATKQLNQAKNNYYDSIVDTFNFVESLTDDNDYSDDDGNFTDKGYAVIKSKLSKMEVYKKEAENWWKMIENLDNTKSQYSEAEYLNQRIELVKEYTNALGNAYNEEKAMHDMLISNLKKQSDALKELISQKKESLRADKSEKDYQKTISEKTKNITDMKKQKAMLQGDTSEEAMAKMQQLDVQIADAEQDLDDTQYEKYLERLEEGLDGLQERFDAVIEKIDNQGIAKSVNDLIDEVNSHPAEIDNGIKTIIDSAGFSEYLKGEDGNVGIGKLNATADTLLKASNQKITMLYDDALGTNGKLNSIDTNMSNTVTNTGNIDTGVGNVDTGIDNVNTSIGTANNVLSGLPADISNVEAVGKDKTGRTMADILGEVDTSLDTIYNAQTAREQKAAQDKQNGILSSTDNLLTQILAALQASGGSSYNSNNNDRWSMREVETNGTPQSIKDIMDDPNNNVTYATNSTDTNAPNGIFKNYNEIMWFLNNNAVPATNGVNYGTLNKKIMTITSGDVLSKSKRVEFAKVLGVRTSSNTDDLSDAEVSKIMQILKNAGFAKGGIVEAVRKNGDDGIGSLKVGEAVLTPEQTKNFRGFVEYLPQLNDMFEAISQPTMPTVSRATNSSSTTIDSVNFEFNLPNVVDSESLIKTIQTDTKVQRTLQNATVGKLNNNTRFGVNRL